MGEYQDHPPSVADPAPEQLRCSACGVQAAAAQRFCGHCGASLRRVCPGCAADNPSGYRFCGGCGAELAPASTPVASAEPPPTSEKPREERRWVTILFADVSGFTAMAEQMDPEDVKALADHCAERLSEEVRRFGGTVLNVVGDAVLAVFGAPLAHEDDAERAVRAGLAIRDCSLSSELGRPIQVHVGINTGEVMAGLVGPKERRDYTVIGDAVNTAARLLSAAPAGSVLVGQETYQSTRRAVHYRELPAIIAKGKEQPVQAWEALHVAAIPEARPLGMAPLIGREEELAHLRSIWARVVRERQPHLITILGEPGIGKSRLVAEFERQLPAEALILHGRCLPYGEALAYGALAMALKELAGITGEDQPEAARAKLGALVSSVIGAQEAGGGPTEMARNLALLVGLDIEADRATSTGDQRTLHASARRFLEGLARRQPLCLIIDDIHWADQALLDLIELVSSRVREALLIVTQARPELLDKRSAWGRGVRSFSSLALAPLSETVEQELIAALCRQHSLPDEVVQNIGRGPGGNPLFAEELVAMIAEHGPASGVPSMIKLLILARLDLLPPTERRTIQLASIFGKVFWARGLLALTQGSADEIAEQLEILEQKDLIRALPRSQLRADREYIFKHDLIRDVAYEMLPRAERRTLHGMVVSWLEQSEDRRIDAYLDLLAHHAVEAGRQQQAITYLIGAAERARRAATHHREAALLGQALTLAQQQDQEPLIADLHRRRGTALARVGLWSDAAMEFEASLAHVPQLDEQRMRTLIDLAMMQYWLLDVGQLRSRASEVLALADAMGRDDLAAEALAVLSGGLSSDGKLEEGLEMYQAALARGGQAFTTPSPSIAIATTTAVQGVINYWLGRYQDSINYNRKSFEFGRTNQDTSSTMLNLPQLGVALAAVGRYREAEQVFSEARQFGREYEHWPLLARTIAMSAGYHLDLFDFAGNQALAEEARELARAYSFHPPVISAGIDLLLNFARREEAGRTDEILDEVTEAAAKAKDFHGWLWRLRLSEAQAEIALARGALDEALRWAGDALEQSSARGRVKYQVLSLDTRARALLRLGRTREAIADLRQAIALARPISSPALFLRPTATLLEVDGDDALAQEALEAIDHITAELSEHPLRNCFLEADPIRLILKQRRQQYAAEAQDSGEH